MTISKNFFVSTVTFLILLFDINNSVAFGSYTVEENDSKPLELLHSKTTASITEFIKLNHGFYVDQLASTIVNGRLTYVLGARIANDNLVAHGAKNQSWPTLQNVAVTFTYPTSGVGKQVTYVAIQVDQASNFGRAYIIGGGLHLRSIAVVVEAYTTNFLNYDAQIYGV